MVRAGGLASRIIGDQVRLTLVGELGDVRPLGSCRWGAGWHLTGPQTPRLFCHSKTDHGWRNDREYLDRTEGVVGSGSRLVPIFPVEMDGSSWSVVPPRPRTRRSGRGMRPAEGIRPCPPGMKNELMAGEGRTDARPLSVEAEEFSPEIKSMSRMAARVRSDGSIDDVPSQTGPGKIIRQRDAVGSTTAVDRTAALIEIAGPAAPANFSGTDVPAVAGTRFLAVADMHSLTVGIEGEPSIISRQRSAVVLDPIVAPRKDGDLMKEMYVLEPLEHLVLGLSLEGGDVCKDEAVGLHPLEHLGVDRSKDLMGGTPRMDV